MSLTPFISFIFDPIYFLHPQSTGFDWVAGYNYDYYANGVPRGFNTSPRNRLAGDSGNIIDAGAGDDYVAAGTGTDIVKGGAGKDEIWGMDGDDILLGEDDNDNDDNLSVSDPIYSFIPQPLAHRHRRRQRNRTGGFCISI